MNVIFTILTRIIRRLQEVEIVEKVVKSFGADFFFVIFIHWRKLKLFTRWSLLKIIQHLRICYESECPFQLFISNCQSIGRREIRRLFKRLASFQLDFFVGIFSVPLLEIIQLLRVCYESECHFQHFHSNCHSIGRSEIEILFKR